MIYSGFFTAPRHWLDSGIRHRSNVQAQHQTWHHHHHHHFHLHQHRHRHRHHHWCRLCWTAASQTSVRAQPETVECLVLCGRINFLTHCVVDMKYEFVIMCAVSCQSKECEKFSSLSSSDNWYSNSMLNESYLGGYSN